MVWEEFRMKLQEFIAIIANINEIAAVLRQTATTVHRIGSERTVTVEPNDIMHISKKLVGYCNQLAQLVPDIDIEIEGGSDVGSLE